MLVIFSARSSPCFTRKYTTGTTTATEESSNTIWRSRRHTHMKTTRHSEGDRQGTLTRHRTQTSPGALGNPTVRLAG